VRPIVDATFDDGSDVRNVDVEGGLGGDGGDGGHPTDATDAADATAKARIGAPCGSDRECSSGTCDLAWPAGYCTKRCRIDGGPDDCGPDAICSSLCALDATVPRCLRICEQGPNADCRGNYACLSGPAGNATFCRPADCVPGENACADSWTCADELCGPMCVGKPG
jgi:hypothetical protein